MANFILFSIVAVSLVWLSQSDHDVYVSKTGIDDGSCSTTNTSCKTWNYAIAQFNTVANDSTNIIYIDSGTYNATDHPDLKINQAELYQIVGQSSPQDVRLIVQSNEESTFFVDIDAYTADTQLAFKNFTYVPMHGLRTQMIHFENGDGVTLSNIIINGTNTVGNINAVEQDLVHVHDSKFLNIDHLSMCDMPSTSTSTDSFHLFRFVFVENITINNMIVGSSDGKYTTHALQVIYARSVEGSIRIKNMYISGYNNYSNSATRLLFFYQNTLNNTLLESITFMDVYGGRFIGFQENSMENQVQIKNLFITGPDSLSNSNLTIESEIISWNRNYNGSEFCIMNSTISNLILGSSGVVLLIDSIKKPDLDSIIEIQMYTNDIYLTDVTFEDIIGNNSIGIIDLRTNKWNGTNNIFIDACTFQNNINFTSMIHCAQESNCNIYISNSIFDGNTGGTYYDAAAINAIILESGANGNVFIESTVFYGSQNGNNTLFWDESDSNITLITDVEFDTSNPTVSPTSSPTVSPTSLPTRAPSVPTDNPTFIPSFLPTKQPTEYPTTQQPTSTPTLTPTGQPSITQGDNGSASGDSSNTSNIMVIITVLVIIVLTCAGIVIIAIFMKKRNNNSNKNGQELQGKEIKNGENLKNYGNYGHADAVHSVEVSSDNINKIDSFADFDANVNEFDDCTNEGIENDKEVATGATNDNLQKNEAESDDHENGNKNEIENGDLGENTHEHENVTVDDLDMNGKVSDDINMEIGIAIQQENKEYEQHLEMNDKLSKMQMKEKYAKEKEMFGVKIEAHDGLENVIMDDIIHHMDTQQ